MTVKADPRALSSFLAGLSEAGLPGADLEVREDLLLLKLAPDLKSKLLTDSVLRQKLVAQARALGFSRLCLELPSE